MALSLVQLQTLRDALINAIASGVLELTHEGKTIRYQSIGQMDIALARLNSEIATASATTTSRAFQIRMQTSKGL